MNKKMTSIVRQLHRWWIRKKIGLCIGWDFFLFLILSGGWLADRELAAFGKIDLELIRSFSHGGNAGKEIYYTVAEKGGRILMELPLLSAMKFIGIFVAVILAGQLLGAAISYVSEDRRIRRTLAPINEIALRADELNRQVFSEDKYQLIQEAISDLAPEDSEELVSLGDAELQGIETAVNNLLVHMRSVYRQQARFVNDASHELRTPIAVIQGYANLLSRWGKEDEKVLEESIAAIQHESWHMQHLVEQLLFLARGDAGKTRLNMEQISLNQLMQEIYEESFMIDQEHPYRYQPWPETVFVYGDKALLKQAVRILVDNGAKYTKKGDEILLSVGRTNEGNGFLQVEDTGIGMAEADIEHMFERFYRADDARSYQGTGLGLSIAKWIIDKHQGHFEILSRTGLGTRIRILLKKSEPI